MTACLPWGVSLLGSQLLCHPACRGRFGQVHRCTEKSTGLSLAAKIIKVKNAKDRVSVRPGSPASGQAQDPSRPSQSAGPQLPRPLQPEQETCAFPASFP